MENKKKIKGKNKIKTYTLDDIKDKYIGKKGTEERELYERELQLEVIGEMIKKVRKERNLTQEQLGELIGVQKAQISKIENNINNITIGTMLKVFQALKTKIKLKIEMEGVDKLVMV